MLFYCKIHTNFHYNDFTRYLKHYTRYQLHLQLQRFYLIFGMINSYSMLIMYYLFIYIGVVLFYYLIYSRSTPFGINYKAKI